MVDWDKSIEAVNKETGKVVAMEFDGRIGDYIFRTTDAPCGATSNTYWNEDGSDRCLFDRWYIRNVKQNEEPLPPLPPLADNTKSYCDPYAKIPYYTLTVKGKSIPEAFGEVLRHTVIGGDVVGIIVGPEGDSIIVTTASGLQFTMLITEARYGA